MKTTMTNHTPGPWTLEAGRSFQTSSGSFYLAYGTDKQSGASHFDNFVELDANARAISALPDLLAAAIAILAKEEDMTDGHAYLEYRELEDAVRKATRSSSCTCDRECHGPVPNYCSEHDGDYSAWLVSNNCD